jgi:hypothetical protein
MKTCPVCQRLYSDEEMIFCLADGTQLLNVKRNVDLDATWRLSPRAIEPAPTQVAPTMPAPQTNESQRLSTIQYQPELQRALVTPPKSTEHRSRTILPWLFGIVVVMAASGVLVAWILTRDRTEKGLASQVPSPSPQATVDTKDQSTPDSAQKNEKGDRTSRTGSKAIHPKTNSPVNAPSVTQTTASIPSRRPPVKKDGGRTAVVPTDNKKKVETPKPTGEAFVPVKP